MSASTAQPETVHLAVYDTMSDWEPGHATAHINNDRWQRQPGRYRVVTVGESSAPVTTVGGMRIVPDVTLDELSPAGSAMLILPGDSRWPDGNRAFAAMARRFLEAGTPVAAICGATAGLAVEGLLDDRRHTSNALEFLQAFGYGGSALYCDVPAVTDGDLITATGTRPVEFAREIFARLDLYEPEVLQDWTRLYRDNDAAGFAGLMAYESARAS